MKKPRLAFIGAGKMAESLILGLLAARVLSKSQISISEVNPQRKKYICRRYRLPAAPDNLAAVTQAEIIILAVKPKDVPVVLAEIAPALRKQKLLISIAAGIKLKSLEKRLKHTAVIRAMPNTPCLIQAGMTAICKGKFVSASQFKTAVKIFRAVGKVIFAGEKDFDAITALSGSGPAFVFAFMEALASAGSFAGLAKKPALFLTLQTVLGAARIADRRSKSLVDLIKTVASPGGTTEAGLKILAKQQFNKIIKSAIMGASKRSAEISKELERKILP